MTRRERRELLKQAEQLVATKRDKLLKQAMQFDESWEDTQDSLVEQMEYGALCMLRNLLRQNDLDAAIREALKEATHDRRKTAS